MVGAVAAKVSAAVPSTRDLDDTSNPVEKIIVDRTFLFEISNWNCHRHTTRWDYDDDAVSGTVRKTGDDLYDTEFFFVLNENLNKGKFLTVTIDPGVLTYEVAEQNVGQGDNAQTSPIWRFRSNCYCYRL